MTIAQLEYFAAAAKLQHYGQAAEELGISESSLSRAIRSLEDELGVVLFDRVGRNVQLTYAGRVLETHASNILNELTAVQRKLHALATDGAHIDIAYVAPLAKDYIPKTIRAFLRQKENRNVSFNFYQGITERNLRGLREGKYDLCFGSCVENESGIAFVPVLEQEMVIIMSAGSELAETKVRDLEIFNRYPVLSYDEMSGLGKATRSYFKEHGLRPGIICACPDENGIAGLVEEGFGIALVADVDTIHREKIAIRHLPKGAEFTHTVYMCYLKDRYQLPAVKRLVSFVRNAAEHSG